MAADIHALSNIGLPVLHGSPALLVRRTFASSASSSACVVVSEPAPDVYLHRYDATRRRVAAEWAQRWADFRNGFEFQQTGQKPYAQLIAAGLSKQAASMFKEDPAPSEAEALVLRSWYDHVNPLEVAFTQKEESSLVRGSSMFHVIDPFNPSCCCPNVVHPPTKLEIADKIRGLQRQLVDMPSTKLTKLIEEHYQQGRTCREAATNIFQDAVEELRTILAVGLNTSISLVPFGSMVYGIVDEGSDMDCLIMAAGVTDPFEQVLDTFNTSPLGWTVWRVVAGKRPVIMLECGPAGRWPKLQIDLSFETEVSVESSLLFKALISSDVRVAPLLDFLKKKFRALGIVRPKDGYFSNYAYLVMAFSVLVELEVVPPLRKGFSLIPPRRVNGWNVARHDVPPAWESRNMMSIGELVLRVLQEMLRNSRIFALTDVDELRAAGNAPSAVPCTADDEKNSTGEQKACVVVCTAPVTFRERAILHKVCESFDGQFLNTDDVMAERQGQHAVSAKVTYLLTEKQASLLVLTINGQAKKLKELSDNIPPWATLVIADEGTDQRLRLEFWLAV